MFIDKFNSGFETRYKINIIIFFSIYPLLSSGPDYTARFVHEVVALSEPYAGWKGLRKDVI